MRRRLIAGLATLVLILGVGVIAGATDANAATLYWSQRYDSAYAKYNPGQQAERVVYSNRVPTWKVGSATGTQLVFQTDCNLVVYQYGRGAVWATNTYTIPRPCSLRFQADGNVVVYDSGGHARWATNSTYGSGSYVDDAQLWPGCFEVSQYRGTSRVILWTPGGSCYF